MTKKSKSIADYKCWENDDKVLNVRSRIRDDRKLVQTDKWGGHGKLFEQVAEWNEAELHARNDTDVHHLTSLGGLGCKCDLCAHMAEV